MMPPPFIAATARSGQQRKRDEPTDKDDRPHRHQQVVAMPRRTCLPTKSDTPRRPALGLRKRERQALHVAQLERDIIQLQRHVQQLSASRDLLVSQRLQRHDDLNGSSTKAVVEYFRVFERGLILSPVNAIAFVQQAMAEDIEINEFTGRDVVIEQWKTHSVCFNDILFRISDVTVLPFSQTEAIVKCVTRSCATISHVTLAMMFPHILHRTDLLKKLIGRRLEGEGRYDFVYNCERQQFVRCDIVMDLFSVFAKLLPDPDDLAALFQQALITDEFYIGEVDEAAQVGRQSPKIEHGQVHVAADEEEDGYGGKNGAHMTGSSSLCSASPTRVANQMALHHILTSNTPGL